MLEKIPTEEDLTALLGQKLFSVWQALARLLDETYEMDRLWNNGGKAWTYEYKYRRGGKTLCGLYAKEACLGFLVILGKEERARFEASREGFSKEVQDLYDEAKTYHDGKWIMFQPTDTTLFEEFLRLLAMKRKPNKK